MKRKLLLFFLLSGIAITSQAQILKGNWLIGGNGNVNLSQRNMTYQNSPDSKSRSFSIGIAPSVGYFISNKTVIGATVNYYYNGSKNVHIPNYRSTTTTIGFGPFMRNYFMLSERAGFFTVTSLASNVQKNRSRTESTVWQDGPSHLNLTASFVPGFTYLLHRNLGAEITIGGITYIRNFITRPNESRVPVGRHFNTGFHLAGFNFGLSYYLNRN